MKIITNYILKWCRLHNKSTPIQWKIESKNDKLYNRRSMIETTTFIEPNPIIVRNNHVTWWVCILQAING